jgi:hypothetical protein
MPHEGLRKLFASGCRSEIWIGDTAVALVSVSLLCDRTEVGAISEIIVSALIR